MKDLDFGYFGGGAEGYAQYMTAFERNFGTNDASCANDDFGSDSDFVDEDDSSDEDF